MVSSFPGGACCLVPIGLMAIGFFFPFIFSFKLALATFHKIPSG